MKRFAILIGTPENPGAKVYRSVLNDSFGLRQFLISQGGGGWHPSEILPLNNTDRRTLLKIIKTIDTDYCFTYYSGHGRYCPEVNDIILNLNFGTEIQVCELITRSQKQLIVTDTCASFSPEEEFFLEGIKPDISNLSSLTKRKARLKFEKQLLKCSDGIIKINSCSPGQLASANQNGGFFTQSMFFSTINWFAGNDKKKILTVESAFLRTYRYMQKHFCSEQTPELFRVGEKVSFPFALK